MNEPKRMRLRMFEQSPGQRHVESRDHYLYCTPTPNHALAVIGTGTIGQEHMRVAALLGRARVHGIYDPAAHSAAVAAEEFTRLGAQTPLVYPNMEAVFDDPATDAIIISTPNHTHYDVLSEAMRSGKAILLEKPMATTVEDAARIVELARAHPAPVHVGLQYRFKAIYSEATYEICQRQSLGRVHTINLFEHRPPFLDKVNQWNKFRACSGGTLVEKCCHYFDLMNRFAGARPARVYASGGQAVNFLDFEHDGRRADIMDNASVIIDYANGVRATFELNMFSPNFHEQAVVCGEGGRLVADERFETFHTRSATSTLSIEHDESAPSRTVDVAHAADIEASGHYGGTYFEHAAFFDRLDGRDSNIATPEEGFWSIVIGAAADASATSGAPVDVRAWLNEQGLEHFAQEI